MPLDAELVASFGEYRSAQRAVDALSDARFPVQNVTIVGTDLRLVEAVTGRLSWGSAAAKGAIGGAWFGLLIGLFLAIFDVDSDWSGFALILWALLWGAIAGAIFGLVAYAFTGGQRDFLSQSQIAAARYDVYVGGGLANRARELLGQPSGSPSPEAPEAPWQGDNPPS